MSDGIQRQRDDVRFWAEADALMAQRHGNDLNPFSAHSDDHAALNRSLGG